MKLLVLHLSDIHFENSVDLIDRFTKIPSVISGNHFEYNNILVIISGDIAFSGEINQYDTASIHLNGLFDEIEKIHNKKPFTCVIPGNHDCNFNIPDIQIRNKIINDVIKDNYNALDKGVITFCRKVQSNYDSFEKTYNDSYNEFEEGLLKIIKITELKKEITLLCFNTSWLSQLHEEEGKLFFPIRRIKKQLDNLKSDLIISIMHHPFPWFNVTNRQELKRYLEKYSDIIITGHEHLDSKEIHFDLIDNYTEYITGDVFYEKESLSKSGFNIIEINFDKNQQRISNYKFANDLYNLKSQSKWFSYERQLSITKRFFEIKSNFKNFLFDVGANFSHPNKEKLILNDIYIYPMLKSIKKSRSPNEVNQFINSKEVVNDIIGNEIIFVGSEKSGKTSLCKTLFIESFNKGSLPIFIEGHRIINTNLDDFDKIISKHFKEQYDFDNLEYFKQLSSNEKIIIIDDFNKTRLNPKYRVKFLNNIIKKYKNLIITVDDLFPLEEILSKKTKNDPLIKNFKQYFILEFGHLLRHKLIEKWILLGQEQFIDDSELIKKIDYSKKIVDTIIGKNFVPSRPIYLLIILQTIEAGHPHDLKESAYGHYYQYLITQALSKLVKQHDELEAYYSYLTELSYYLYKNKIKEITRENLLEFHNWYCYDEYKVSPSFENLINIDKLLDIFIDSSILYNYAGSYSFRYKYIYYYFVSKYFSLHLAKSEIKKEIERLLSFLYIEEYANIIVFLTHHTKETFIIDGILNNAIKIFSEYTTVNFEKDIDAINKLIDTIPKFVVEDRDVRENRDRVMRIKDQIEEEENGNNTEENLSELQLSELDLFTALNLSFKYIEIIGQLLKNYHSSLNAKSRYKLGLEAYKLGMRSLNVFFSGLQDNLDSLINEIIDSIKDPEKKKDEEIEVLSRKILFSMCFLISTGFIKKLSTSIGHEKLSETFKEILSNNLSNSFYLIDISIKLDFYKNFPFSELKMLNDKFKEHGLPHVTLQRLVINYLYMFPTSEKDKQKICSILGIPVDTQRMIEKKSPEKK